MLNSTDPSDMNSWEEQFAQLARRSGLHKLPEQVHDNLTQLFTEQNRGQRAPNLWKQLIAALAFDSRQTLTPLGVRSAAATETRQLVYSSDAGDLAFDLTWKHDMVQVNGQMFIDAADYIQFIRLKERVATAIADEFGEFELHLPEGSYQIIISTPTHEILLEDVPLRVS